MRVFVAIALLALCVSCNGSTRQYGWTRVHLVRGAEAPCDLPDTIAAIERVLIKEYDVKTAEKILSVDVVLYPESVEPPCSDHRPAFAANGCYQPGPQRIHARLMGRSFARAGVITHEIFAHRMWHVTEGHVGGHIGRYRETEQRLTAMVLERVGVRADCGGL